MYNILEIANTHGGDINYIFSVLQEFEEFNKKNNFGIKFQPFKYDNIATTDYAWYNVYKKLYFNKNEWKQILKKAYETKDVLIDLFDEYGITIIKQNLTKISGIKLQTSILDNEIIFEALKNINLKNINLIINVAGRTKINIDYIINKFSILNSKEILLEVGFQAYPTKLEDSGLFKIKYLKENYPNKIVFADHVDGKSKDAIILPLIASMHGADCIEKHIMHSNLGTKYDYFSSVTLDTYKEFIDKQKHYLPLLRSQFLNDAEKNYFKTTYQIPLLKKCKNSLSLVDVSNDFIFRRSSKLGLNIDEIKELSARYYILNKKLSANEALKKEYFKKANIAAIIACRLKSTRLEKKAILNIDGISSIELCIKNTLKINNINHVILATSYNEQDAELENYTYNESVIFHQGDPDDVIQRYLDIINKLKIDVFVRITGDMQYVSSDITEYLLTSHFANGADYTVAKEFATGTSVEIINSSALRKIRDYFPSAKYSEYMTWYFQNNSEYFNLNFVDLPSKWIRNYRLTLDYQEDLDMFVEIEKYFKKKNIEFSIEALYSFLDSNRKISSLNSHLTLRYKEDQKLIELLNKETKIK